MKQLKILVVSDTHRRDSAFAAAYEKEKPIDMLIHAGDAEGSEDDFQRMVKVPMHYVAGNNDFFTLNPGEDFFFIGPLKVFLTHGHRYHVSSSIDYAVDEAKAQGADILIFGHSHVPLITRKDNLLVMNPGSLGYPRQIGRKPSYIVLTVTEDGQAEAEIRYLGA